MLKENKTHRMVVVGWLFFALVFWRLVLLWVYPDGNQQASLLWGACYQVLALYGMFFGFKIAKGWGGMNSVMGKAIIFFACGLLFQAIGQSVFSFYNLILKVEIPYPSIADIFYFGSIPFYIYGSYLLGRASGNLTSLKSFKNKARALLLPALLLLLSYEFFLRNYEFDFSNPIKIFLDFGYPFGQAIYISVALLTYLLSKNMLGGLMKSKVLFILIALGVQYLADYNFLFQAQHGTWINGGYGDFIYLTAYFMMAIGLINLVPDFIHNESQS